MVLYSEHNRYPLNSHVALEMRGTWQRPQELSDNVTRTQEGEDFLERKLGRLQREGGI